MTEIVRYEDRAPTLAPTTPQTAWVGTLAAVAELAGQIANTEFVPQAMRRDPAKVTACILFGQEMGLGPMQSLAKVDIIDGRPAPKAELARALVLAAGHDIAVEPGPTRCTARGRRKGSTEWTEVTWTMDDAKRAGLDGKQNWRKWPRQMLAARATAELARLLFADCLAGVSLFAEELEDDAEPSAAAPAPKPAKKAGRKLAATHTAAAPKADTAPVADDEPPLPDEDIEDAEIVEDRPTKPQMAKLHALFGSVGFSKDQRDERLALASSIVGQPLASSADMTKDQASKVIDTLMAVEDQRAELRYDRDGTPFVHTLDETED